ncbi:MAG: sodium/solute symporter [Candidatus Acetothermia bacterium]|jgi:SSS family solute:Na+ symporter|nr:sodium/solute symporter [Candidatus Acetothermia bacterium]MDH7506070.1 sodium/solute symporter [Candidatus Acetothermia bacterium]
MSERAIYSIVLALYLSLLLLVGLFTSRRLRHVGDFYLGGRRIGPWVTAFSYVAAYFSSVVIIGGGGFGYKYGMATLWIGAINVLLGCTLAWIVLGKRVREFTTRLGTMTIPGFVAERFRAREARLFLAAVITVFLIVYNVSILKGMGHTFEVLMGLPYTWGVLLSGAIIVLYVAWGGYLAVVWTGFFQAWVMGAGLILLAFGAVKAVGGLAEANLKLMAIDPGLVETPGTWGWAGLVSYCLIVSFGVWGMPQMVIRFYSIKDVRMLRIGAVVASLGGSMALLPYLCGAIARVLHPGLASPDLAIPTLTKAVLSPWGGAVFFAGVLAAGMSTFSSVLIITSSALVRDFLEEGLNRRLSERQALRLSRISSLIVGLVALLIALRPPGLILVLTAFAWAVIASTTLWPLLFGIYWKGATRLGALFSMVGGFLIALIWMAIGSPFGVHGFIPGLGVGLILLVLVSRFTEKLPEGHLARLWGEREPG